MTELLWNINHQKLYIRLFNLIKIKYKDVTELNYITIVTAEKVKIFIDELTLGASSKKSFYFLVLRWLEINDPKNRNIAIFRNSGASTKKAIEDIEKTNTLTGKEIDTYQNYEYYKNILDKIDFNEYINIKNNYKNLLLALLVLQPPLRTFVYISAIIATEEKDDENNYIIIKKDEIYFYINKDKVSSTKKFLDASTKKILITDDKLKNIILDSYDKYKRTYLFQNPSGKPTGVTSETLLRYLRDITKIEKINIDMLRSAYTTHIYNKKNVTYAEKEALALQMRNSVEIASISYYKILND